MPRQSVGCMMTDPGCPPVTRIRQRPARRPGGVGGLGLGLDASTTPRKQRRFGAVPLPDDLPVQAQAHEQRAAGC